MHTFLHSISCLVAHRCSALTFMNYGKIAPVYAAPAAVEKSKTPVCPDRPARVQVEQKRALQTVEHAGDYNIWYGKYMGENNYDRAPRASTRVVLESDAGLTRADYTGANMPLCLHFARGDCVYGKDCTFHHRAPTEVDESQVDSPHDVFGRTRHGSFRDDMGGTGTWNKDCKTLYVGRLSGKPTEAEMTEIVAQHFGEFGQLESVRVLKGKSCAFVMYRLRCAAEFAKEAMAEQALDHDEQINVRWAYDDPNPKAQANRLRNSAQLMLAAMEAKGYLPSTAGAYPNEVPEEGGGMDRPGAKRPRDWEASAGDALAPLTREEHADAEARLHAAAEAAAAEETAAAEEAARLAAQQEAANNASRLDAILSSIGTDDTHGSGSGKADGDQGDPLSAFLSSVDGDGRGSTYPVRNASATVGGGSSDLPPGVWQPRGLPPGWQEYTDPATGHPYFVSPQGDSTWRRPS